MTKQSPSVTFDRQVECGLGFFVVTSFVLVALFVAGFLAIVFLEFLFGEFESLNFLGEPAGETGVTIMLIVLGIIYSSGFLVGFFNATPPSPTKTSNTNAAVGPIWTEKDWEAFYG